MAHHGAVQPVLGHDAAPPPRLGSLPLLSSPVLEPDLPQQSCQYNCGLVATSSSLPWPQFSSEWAG